MFKLLKSVAFYYWLAQANSENANGSAVPVGSSDAPQIRPRYSFDTPNSAYQGRVSGVRGGQGRVRGVPGAHQGQGRIKGVSGACRGRVRDV